MTWSLLYTYGTIALIAEVWVGVISSLQPTHPVEGGWHILGILPALRDG